MGLQISNLNVSYGQIQVIRDVSFDVSIGELLCIFGSNGHGKSTLLKAICGLVKASSGKIKYRGTELTRLDTHEIVKHRVVYIPEERNLFNGMTVIENLRLGAYLLKNKAKEEENLAVVFELFPRLEERKKQLVSSLSGGERRMVAVGRGLMTDADFLLIDEPSIGLSPLLRTETYQTIRRINKEKNCTVILVEQDIKGAIKISDRVFLLKNGRLVFEGTQETITEEMIRKAFF